MRMTFEVGKINNRKNTFNAEKQKVGWEWLRVFLKRHPELSIRTLQCLSSARIQGFTQKNVASFFDKYEEEMKNINYNPSGLYNVEETGITIVQHKTTQVIGKKSKTSSFFFIVY